jgi:uncharacterized protein involved in exopolysaccharide biosynthesis
MEFYRTWRILIAHKSVLIWLPIIATCVALGLTYVLPEQYESTALVLVRPYEEIKFDSSNPGNREVAEFPVNLSAPIDALSKTYMEVIKSPAVAVRIVDALQLQLKKPQNYQSWSEAIKDKIRGWVKNSIRTLRNYCKYGRDIPASPFDLAVENVENNLRVSVRKDTYAFDITARSTDPKEAAAIANMAAKIFVEHSADAYRSESARAREFIEVQLDQSRNALKQARAAILAYKSSGATFDLKSEYDETLKNVSDLQNSIAKTEGKLAGLTLLASRFTPNARAQEAEIGELRRLVSAMQEQLAAYPQKEIRINSLTLTERLAEESYEFFLKKYQEARIKESENVTEIRIVSPAVADLYPVKPLKYMYVGLSFATALVVAIGWALLFESFDPRVRTLRDLDGELGVPVLGAIPRSVPAGR